MTKIERLEIIAAKAAADLTKGDKDFITTMSRDMGVEFTPRSKCADCYADQAVVLWKMVKDGEAAHKDAPQYILKEGVDVMFGSLRVCEATLTDEMAESIIARGFSKIFFAKCK